MRRIAMRSILRVGLISILLGVHSSLAQEVLRHEIGPTGEQVAPEPEAITGCRFLWEENDKLLKYLRDHPEALSVQKTAGPAWDFVVGSQYNWWATSFVTNTEYQVPSTCRAVGTNAYYFVEDSLWNRGRVTQAQVDSIAAAFDFRTPAFPTKGIYQVDVETFGDPPNVDNDPKLIILLLDIKDGYAGTGSFVAGYFFSLNQFPDGTFAGRRSNYAEIFYQDADPLNLASPGGLASAIRTTAHEFQHMIHWNYDRNELTFINEACSEVAEVIIGYPVRGQSLYVNNPNVHLLQWDRNNPLPDYARAARWGLYLWNQFPNDYLKKLVQSTLTGIAGMNAAFAAYPTTRRFDDVFRDWLVANYLNDRAVHPNFGYMYTGALPRPGATTHLDPNTGVQSGSVMRLAAEYITFSRGSNLRITFSSTSVGFGVRAIKVGPASKRVVEVAPNVEFSEPGFGTTYTAITFVILNSSSTFDAIYSYQATGTAFRAAIEMKYDDGVGLGVLGLSPNDTIAVYFDPLQGAALDSIRIAFRRVGTISVGLWRYTGVIRPTPLGSVLVPTFSVNVAAADTNILPFPTTEATTRWKKIDLSTFRISTSDAFVVAAVIGPNPLAPGVLVAKTAHTGSPHYNYTFLNSQTPPNWFYLTADGGSNVWLYMIRAYASLTTPVGVTEVIELTPRSFTLRQNYPNPFNPSTKIEYRLPTSGLVLLRIYDVLGREIRTLVNEHQEAGTYRTEWDGKDNRGVDAVSGVYFYQLRTKNFVQTKKMVLVR